jgi:RNA polymerase sigma-B factor
MLRSYHQSRSPHLRSRLVEAYLPLVLSLARRYVHRGERLEDLVQVGAIGLLEAIDRFDPERGLDFGCFAVPTITGRIRNHLRDRGTAIRVPRGASERRASLRPHRERLSARLSREPTVEELAEATGIAEAAVVEALAIERACAPVRLPDDDRALVRDRSAPAEDSLAASEDRLLLAAGFRALTKRERRILHLRFYGELSQSEIACELGLSQIHVSRLIRSSLERLRGALSDGAETALVTRSQGRSCP